jgi:hypothetical protein
MFAAKSGEAVAWPIEMTVNNTDAKKSNRRQPPAAIRLRNFSLLLLVSNLPAASADTAVDINSNSPLEKILENVGLLPVSREISALQTNGAKAKATLKSSHIEISSINILCSALTGLYT